MRKLLNTLFVLNPDSYLSKENEDICLTINDEKPIKIPIHNIENIVCFAHKGATTKLMAMCAERKIGMSFHNSSGKFLFKIQGKTSGNILLRKKQYKINENLIESCLISRNFILGKLINYKSVLNRFKRDYSEKYNKHIENAINLISDSIHKIKTCTDLDELRGIEGYGSKIYFSVFDYLILQNKADFKFDGRNKRPPTDRINSMLSFIYTLLNNDMTSALESVGLDPQAGFLHRDRPGRNSLALDLIEELRPYMGDRFVLSLINKKLIDKSSFIIKENQSVLITEDGKKTILSYWQKRKKETITHPFLKEKIEIGLLPYVQALLLSRNLRGDLDAYPPFLLK